MDPVNAPQQVPVAPVPVEPLPYYTPAGAVVAGGSWRRGPFLITVRDVELPPFCVKCGLPVEGRKPLKRLYSWHSPILYLLILPGILIYAIVASIVQKRATLRVHLCPAHRGRRRNFILIAWAISLGSAVALFASTVLLRNPAVPVLISVLGIFAGLVAGLIGSRMLTPTNIDEHYATFKGASPAFLDHLPPC